MTTFIRGKQGIIDLIIAKRNTTANSLLNDDKRKERGEQHMSLGQRAKYAAEISAFNLLITYLSSPDVHVVSEAEYDGLEDGISKIRIRLPENFGTTSDREAHDVSPEHRAPTRWGAGTHDVIARELNEPTHTSN